jgi:CRISPR-associated protein Cas8a1/Csx13
MGKGMKAKATNTELSALHIDLFGPGMTALHKIGLAGLWMTLKALEKNERAKTRLKKAAGSWDYTPTSVSVRWNGTPEAFFNVLFEESFKIDKNGMLWFPGLGGPLDHPQHAVLLQEAILGSFLQHGQTRKADKSQDPQGKLSVEVDEAPLILRYHKVTKYAHQDAKFSASGVNRLASWHFPGGAVRHVGLGQDSTALEEPPGRALVLRFALVGAIYFALRRVGARTHYALVLPEISDLESYANARACFLRYGVQQLHLSGTAEAGLRVLAELHASGLLQDIDTALCRVISFGTVPWSSQQKTRIELFTVRARSERTLRTFASCQHLFLARLVKPQNSRPFWDVPMVPDLVARNLSQGHEWWRGFADFLANQDRRDHVLGYLRDRKTKKLVRILLGEKGGLVKMVEIKNPLVQALKEVLFQRVTRLGDVDSDKSATERDVNARRFEI